MSELVFLAHIPLLRLERESVPFADGDLWQMPFKHYDALTLGDFSGHRANYEATAPVFYRFMVIGNLDLTILQPGRVDPGKTAELKMPSNDRNFLHKIGMSFLANFHDKLVDRVWAALLLAAPAGAYPDPRLSMSAVISTGDASFIFRQERCTKIRVQGDADQEYLFFAEAAGAPLRDEVLQRASSLLDVIDKAHKTDELNAALSSFLAATSPSLSPNEQLTMSVVALEALLLPEVRSGLGSTFANRLSSLLASDPEQHAALQRLSHQLYKSRSAAVHGLSSSSSSPLEEFEHIHDAYAQQILAAAIAALTDRARPGQSWDKLRIDLDKIPEVFKGSGAHLPLSNPPGLRRFERLTRPLSPIAATVFSSVSAMHAEEGTLLSWSPLVGLGTENVFAFGNQDSPIIMPVTGSEIVTLEEKDIARDFIAQLHVLGKPIACLALSAETPDLVDREGIVQQLLRKKDLAVVALRLSGFKAFHDPALLGLYIYEGLLRYRHPTVLRQTLLTMLRAEPDAIIHAEDMKRVLPTWQMLVAYDATARHPEIDNVLTMFRRIFDSRFIPTEARAGLMLSTLEAMLGRFRRKDDLIQLEQLIANLIGEKSEAAIWFNEQGRQFRNSVAHGHWDLNSEGPLPLNHMVEILQAIIPAFISSWVDLGNRAGQRPSNVLIEHVSKVARTRSN